MAAILHEFCQDFPQLRHPPGRHRYPLWSNSRVTDIQSTKMIPWPAFQSQSPASSSTTPSVPNWGTSSQTQSDSRPSRTRPVPSTSGTAVENRWAADDLTGLRNESSWGCQKSSCSGREKLFKHRLPPPASSLINVFPLKICRSKYQIWRFICKNQHWTST